MQFPRDLARTTNVRGTRGYRLISIGPPRDTGDRIPLILLWGW